MSRILFDTEKHFDTEKEMSDYMDLNPDKEFHHGKSWGYYFATELNGEPQPETQYFPSDNYGNRRNFGKFGY